LGTLSFSSSLTGWTAAALALGDVGQLVGEQLVAALGAGPVLAAAEEDVGADGERAGLVGLGHQRRGIVGVQPRRAGGPRPDVRCQPRRHPGRKRRRRRVAAEQPRDLAARGPGHQAQDRRVLRAQLAQRRRRRVRIRRGQDIGDTAPAAGERDQVIPQGGLRFCIRGTLDLGLQQCARPFPDTDGCGVLRPRAPLTSCFVLDPSPAAWHGEWRDRPSDRRGVAKPSPVERLGPTRIVDDTGRAEVQRARDIQRDVELLCRTLPVERGRPIAAPKPPLSMHHAPAVFPPPEGLARTYAVRK